MASRLFRFVLAPLAVGGILLSSCSSGGTPPASAPRATGVITGTLVMDVGVIAPPFGGAVPGVVSASGVHGEQKIYSQRVPSEGRFTLHVVPGTYVLDGRTPRFNGGQGLCGGRAVTVAKNTRVQRDVACEGP